MAHRITHRGILVFAVMFAAVAGISSGSAAQSAAPATNAMEAPPVLWIEREVVQPGKMEAHNDVVHKILEKYNQQKVVFRALGAAGILPDQDEVLFLIHFKSFAEIDEFQKQFGQQPADFQKSIVDLEAQENATHASKQSMAAIFRADLSYRADASAVAKARLLWACQFIVPAGHLPEFESDIHFLSDVYTKAGVDDHYFMYQTVAGAESTTFLVLRPMKSFGDWDNHAPDLAKFLDEAGKFRLAHIWKDETLSGPGTSVERLYVLRPDLSQTSDKFASFDPDFWRPKK